MDSQAVILLGILLACAVALLVTASRQFAKSTAKFERTIKQADAKIELLSEELDYVKLRMHVTNHRLKVIERHIKISTEEGAS